MRNISKNFAVVLTIVFVATAMPAMAGPAVKPLPMTTHSKAIVALSTVGFLVAGAALSGIASIVGYGLYERG